MKLRDLPSAEEIRAAFNYDPQTGFVTRRVFVGGRYGGRPGDIAGSVNDQGYVIVSHRCRRYRVHRLAYVLMTGSWPTGEIDHRNGVRHDNRWDNLRDVPTLINAQNKRRAQKNSKTGLLGASADAKTGRFIARIKAGDKYRVLGLFDTADAAHSAYVQAKRQLHAGCTI